MGSEMMACVPTDVAWIAMLLVGLCAGGTAALAWAVSESARATRNLVEFYIAERDQVSVTDER